MQGLSGKMKLLIPADIMRLLKRIGRLANSLRYTAFLVGGPVRDIILGVKNLDLDIVVEGEAIKFGEILAKDLDEHLVTHKRFGTCSITMKNNLKIDFATARKEVYEKLAALPVVEFSSLKEDLLRRDFTVNAMAISLNSKDFGVFIDPYGGRRDLKKGIIGVMHDKSFIDDPTRIFRAVRFEKRFGFTIERHTKELILDALKKGMLERLDTHRVRKEVLLILKEEKPLEILERLAELYGHRIVCAKKLMEKIL